MGSGRWGEKNKDKVQLPWLTQQVNSQLSGVKRREVGGGGICVVAYFWFFVRKKHKPTRDPKPFLPLSSEEISPGCLYTEDTRNVVENALEKFF